MKTLFVIISLLLANCSQSSYACKRHALQQEMLCLQSNGTRPEDRATKNIGIISSQDRDSLNKCKLLYKLSYQDCVWTARDLNDSKQE